MMDRNKLSPEAATRDRARNRARQRAYTRLSNMHPVLFAALVVEEEQKEPALSYYLKPGPKPRQQEAS
jgi:hypothetical protein